MRKIAIEPCPCSPTKSMFKKVDEPIRKEAMEMQTEKRTVDTVREGDGGMK